MDTGRWLYTWALLCLGLVAMTTGEPDPLRRHFGDETRRRRLKVVTIQSDPYIRLNWSRGLIGNERYEGYYTDLISRLADLAGFDYSLHLVGDGKLGHEGDEGGWTGMVGELLTETADMTLGPLSVTRERQAVVDFTSPIAEVKLAIIMAKVKVNPGSNPTSSTPPSTTTLPALLARSDLKFAALRDSDAVQALMTSLDSNARSLYRRLQEQSMTSLMSNMYEALEFVRREGYALVLDKPTAEYYIGREPCDLALVASFLEGRHYALATRKGAPLLGELNRALETLKGQSSQTWHQLRRKWWQPQCPGISIEGATDGLGANSGKIKVVDGVASTSTSPPMLHLKVTTELIAPFVIRPPDGPLSGYTIELLENIARLVPFRYDVTFPRDNAGFGKRKRSQWSGMAGELVREEVDLAAAPFTSNRARDRVLSYTKPFLHSTLSILIKTSITNDELPIFFMEDLLNQTEYTYGVLRGSHLEKDLKLSQEHVASEIWKNIEKDKRRNIVRTLEDGIQKVRNEKYALIIPSTFATYLSSKAPCDLMALDQFMFITNYMFAVKKGNALVDKIDEALIRLQEDGVLQMLFHKWWNTGDCLGATEPPKANVDHKNDTTNSNHKQTSTNWVHGLFTLSTRWHSPVTTTQVMAPKTTTTLQPPPVATDNSQEQTTKVELIVPDSVDPVLGPIASETDDAVINRDQTSAGPTEPLVRQTSTAVPVEVTTHGRRRENEKGTKKHRHRHGSRGQHRGRSRDRERNRNRKRNRNHENTNTTDVTQVSSESNKVISEEGIAVLNNGLGLRTTTTSMPSTSASPPPKPPVWDGKYVYEDDFLSTRSPENFTIDLELIPAEEDSMRIFPFTYKPHPGNNNNNNNNDNNNPLETEHAEEDFQATSVRAPTAIPPVYGGEGRDDDRHPQRTITPSIDSGQPAWKDVIRKTEPEWSDNVYPGTTPLYEATQRNGEIATPRVESDIAGSGTRVSLTSANFILILISTVYVSMWLCTTSSISIISRLRLL